MLIAIWPLVLAVIGVLVYALSSNPKISNIGMWVFVCGFFWVVYTLMGHTLKIGG